MNLELEVMRLGNLEAMCDETMNLGSWEWPGKELKTLGMTQENEDRDKDQGDKMGWNENTGLMCPWLVLNPLKRTKEVTSIYICELKYVMHYNILENISKNMLEPSRIF